MVRDKEEAGSSDQNGHEDMKCDKGKSVVRSGSFDSSTSRSFNSVSVSKDLSSQIPLRFRSLVDVAGSATCSTSYGLDSSITGKASVAIQVPASSLPSPFCTSVVASSFQSGAPTAALFPSLPPLNSTVSHAQCPISSNFYSQSGRISTGQQDEESQGSSVSRESFPRVLTEVFDPQQNDGENEMMQWLQALELQAIGACRADERLRPLLRWNVSCFGADGRLLGRLGLHFKAKELAMLARCLCAPLISIRVGKIVSQGRILRPTPTRGHLNLMMLPTSDLRLSFVGDGGTFEILAVVTPCSEDPPIVLEGISADSSGRSFVLKLPGNRLAFFWQSEKSKAAGDELISKMKDILIRQPTLSQLTGIHESRLDSFATLVPVASSSTPLSTVSTRTSESTIVPPTPSSTSASITLTCLRRALPCSTTGCQASDDPEINIVSSESVPIGVSLALTGECLNQTTSGSCPSTVVGSTSLETSDIEVDGVQRLLRSSREVDKKAFAQRILGSLPQSLVPFPLLVSGSASAFIPPHPSSIPVATTSLFTPYYCPCPLGSASALQCTFTPPFLPSVPSETRVIPSTTLPLPPLVPPPLYSPLLFSSSSSGLVPPFFPDPLPLHQGQIGLHQGLVGGSSSIGVVLPSCPLRSESAAAGSSWRRTDMFQGGLGDILEVYSAGFPTTRAGAVTGDPSRVFGLPPASSGLSLSSLYCGAYQSAVQPAFENIMHVNQPSGPMMGIVPGVLSSNTISRVISFCPDRVSTASSWAPSSFTRYSTPQQVPHSVVSSQSSSAENISQVGSQGYLSLTSMGLTEGTSMLHDKAKDENRPQ